MERTAGGTLIRYGILPADSAVLELITTYGRADGSSDEVFYDIASLAVDSVGNVYVYDLGSGIRQFSPRGRFMRWIAKEGRGPGEVAFAMAMTAWGDGDLAVYDSGNRRIAHFSPGRTAVTVSQAHGIPPYGRDAIVHGSDGSLWIGLNPGWNADGVIAFPRPIYGRLSSDGVVDTLRAPEYLGAECPVWETARYRAGVWMDRRAQWFPMVTWALGPDGSIAWGCPADFAFEVVSPDGRKVRIEHDWQPVRTAEAEATFHETFWQPIPTLPRDRPAYVRLILPGDGTVWVWPVQPSEIEPLPAESRQAFGISEQWVPGGHGAFEVYRADGTFKGHVPLPSGVRYSGYADTPPVLVRGDTIWAVVRNNLDIQTVGRFAIHW